jgi:peptidoglycan/LPS O-acetylase OafA/YrhL
MAQQDNTNRGSRLYFLDNLKVFIIFLVVVYHAGYVYDAGGMLSHIWIVDDPAKSNIAGLLNLMLDMFMMPIMFFISGYFAPVSVQSKKGWTFLSSRFKRLMIPWVIAVLTLIPLYKVIYLYSRDLPQVSLMSYFHFNGEILINQGWLWFLPVLFLFDTFYFLLSKTIPAGFKFNLKGVILAVFLINVLFSLSMSLYGPPGWTKTFLLDFQNDRLLMYFLYFLLGSQFYQHNVFTTAPTGRKLYYLTVATIWIPMNLYVVVLLNLFTNPGNYMVSRSVDLLMVWTGFHLTAFGMLYLLVNTFRYWLNRRGEIAKALGQYSYGVYIIHFIVMGFIALVLLNISFSSFGKFIILTILTFIASNLLIFFYKTGRQLLRTNARSVNSESGVLVKP